ncbi:hypothetical protein QR680_001292 [Steinernema hermaphroditum]|uniref:Peptidase M1 membrane alanine aminopeptidase domain-containing protein n=1 Tax=Steinernema hermaphroditum TaxID=289476 RepID=A0AA39GXP1_9BILA|nr:hypothetical protein QR680_001292 [Steinernema hermaphroditum]
MWVHFVCSLSLLLLFSSKIPSVDAVQKIENYNHSYRLPKTFRPIVYDLKLTVSDKEDFTKGQVTIEIQCQEPSDEIIISVNPLYLQITNSYLEDKLRNLSMNLGKPTLDFDTFTARFALPYTIEKGYVTYLKIWFKGMFSTSESGFVRRNNEKRDVWFYTLFEPSNARRMFPCFDEPGFKAFFVLQLWLTDGLAQQNYVALSNTNGHKFEWNDRLTIWTFDKSPPISTYLFTIVIGQFISSCAPDDFLIDEICIWRFSDISDWNNTAQHIIGHMSRFQSEMTDYLLIDPGTRLHIIFLPLELNGMENAGLLYISDRLWPADDESSQIRFGKTLFHEMTHQWFGNLVTMEWWDDIWLSESLTSYLSTAHPFQHNVVNDITEDPIVSPKWATAIPRIVYAKGAAILRMLEDVIGVRRMRTLLRNYVRMNQFGTANTEKFFSLLDSVTEGLSFNGTIFLKSWLFQGSHPLIFVDFDRTTNQFCFTQTPKVGDSSTRWQIPIWIEALDDEFDTEQLYWIPSDGQLVIGIDEVSSSNNSATIAFNRNHTVYYQLIYRY